MSKPYRLYAVLVQVTTAEGIDKHEVTVYARSDAEAREFAVVEMTEEYRGREAEFAVVESGYQRNRL